jgi:hypothetical protein
MVFQLTIQISGLKNPKVWTAFVVNETFTYHDFRKCTNVYAILVQNQDINKRLTLNQIPNWCDYITCCKSIYLLFSIPLLGGTNIVNILEIKKNSGKDK